MDIVPLEYKKEVEKKFLRSNVSIENSISLKFFYHGIPTLIHFESLKMCKELLEKIPNSWQMTPDSFTPEIEINWLDASKWCDGKVFDEDPNADYIFEYDSVGNKRVYQRDLILSEIDKGKFFAMTLPEVTDGFFNVFRLILPYHLLKHSCFVFHSSAIVVKKEAYMFLGECDAGKSTVASLAKSIDDVYGDDINIVSIKDDGIYISSAFLGGNPIYKRDFSFETKLKASFWIHKDSNYWLRNISPYSALTRLAMSMFLWTPNNKTYEYGNSALKILKNNLNKFNIFDLGFKKDSELWSFLEREI